MPTAEVLQVSAASVAIAKEAHRKRTRDRLEAWQQKLATSDLTQDERDLIATEMDLLARQLELPVTRRTLLAQPPTPQPVEPANPLMALVISLKAQVEALTANLKGSHGPVSESAQAPQEDSSTPT